jgi:ATPases involved in chromosome partitioning
MGTIARRVITFYSFKGGVGRSFALCDVAVFLAKWGYEVLCVDFDLEAPGLHNYFAPWLSSDTEPRPGVLEILKAWGLKEPDEEVSQKAIQQLNVPETDNRLSLVTAGGQAGEKYVRRLHAINWTELFDKDHQAGRRLEALRDRWLERFDIVLIDSRTGWSDIGQLCTIHLPDILVVLFTPNIQSLEGAIEVADASQDAVGRLPVDRAPLRVVPVLTRVDKDEFEAQQEWTRKLLSTAARFVEDWDPQEDTPPGVLAELVVPYVPYWAYGERIAALTTEVVPTLSVARAHENLAAIIAKGLSEAGLLLKFRDSYVEGAAVGASSSTTLSERAAYDAYISYPKGRSELAVNLAQALRKRGIRVFVDQLALQPGDLWEDVLIEAQKRSQTFLMLLDGTPLGYHAKEIDAILKVTRERQTRLIPVVLSGWGNLPDNLARYQGVAASSDSDETNVNKLADELYPAIQRIV